MCFKRYEAISTLSVRLLKFVEKFTYLGSNISSIKSDVNINQAKAGIERLSIIWKSDLSNEIKQDFFPSYGCVNTNVWMHHMDAKIAG